MKINADAEKGIRLGSALALLLGAATAWAGPAGYLEGSGVVELLPAGSERVVAAGREPQVVFANDRIATRAGSATLSLNGGGIIRLAENSELLVIDGTERGISGFRVIGRAEFVDVTGSRKALESGQEVRVADGLLDASVEIADASASALVPERPGNNRPESISP